MSININFDETSMDMVIARCENNIEDALVLLSAAENLQEFIESATPTKANLNLAGHLVDTVNLHAKVTVVQIAEMGVHGESMPDLEGLKELPAKVYRGIANFIRAIIKAIRGWFTRTSDESEKRERAVRTQLELFEEFCVESDKLIDQYGLTVGKIMTEDQAQLLKDAGDQVLVDSAGKVIRWEIAKNDLGKIVQLKSLKGVKDLNRLGGLENLADRLTEDSKAITALIGYGCSTDLFSYINRVMAVNKEDEVLKLADEITSVNKDYVEGIFSGMGRYLQSKGGTMRMAILGTQLNFTRRTVATIPIIVTNGIDENEAKGKVAKRVTWDDISRIQNSLSDLRACHKALAGLSEEKAAELSKIGEKDAGYLKEARERLSSMEVRTSTMPSVKVIDNVVRNAHNLINNNHSHHSNVARLIDRAESAASGTLIALTNIKKMPVKE